MSDIVQKLRDHGRRLGQVEVIERGTGSGGAPTTASYVTTAADGTLSAEVVIPGLAGSPDVKGVAGAGTAREFESGDTAPTWSPSSPSSVDVGTTVASHLYMATTDSTERFGLYSWAPAGDFDARCKIAIGVASTSVGSTGMILTDAGNTTRILFLLGAANDQPMAPYVDAATWVAQPYTYAAGTYTQRARSSRVLINMLYQRIRRSGTTIEWYASPDGNRWTLLGTHTFSITVANIGFRLSDNPANVVVDWLRTDV